MTREESVLAEIMDSIARLKESNGSPILKIMNDISAHRATPIRNSTLQVKKALIFGVKSGLVKEKGGRFKIGLRKNDFNTFNKFRKSTLALPVKQLRRRRGRRSRSRKRRGRRRRRGEYEYLENLDLSDKGGEKNTFLPLNKLKAKSAFDLPIRQLRRRGGRRRRSRSRRGRGRRRKRADFEDLESFGKDSDESGDFILNLKNLKAKSTINLPLKELRGRRRRRSRSRKRRGRRRRRADFEDIENFLDDSEERSFEPVDRGRRRRGKRRRSRRRRGRRRGLGADEEVLSHSSQSYISNKSLEIPDPAKSQNNGEAGIIPGPEKPIISLPPPETIRRPESNHCIHDNYHCDGPYGPIIPPYPGYFYP